MTYTEIQDKVIKEYRININEHSTCYGRTHAHIKTRMKKDTTQEDYPHSTMMQRKIGTSTESFPIILTSGNKSS